MLHWLLTTLTVSCIHGRLLQTTHCCDRCVGTIVVALSQSRTHSHLAFFDRAFELPNFRTSSHKGPSRRLFPVSTQSPCHHSNSTANVPQHLQLLRTTLGNMTDNKYPQLLLLGDSILQFTSYLPHGVSFGAGLAERKSMSFSLLLVSSSNPPHLRIHPHHLLPSKSDPS